MSCEIYLPLNMPFCGQKFGVFYSGHTHMHILCVSLAALRHALQHA